MWTCFTRKCLVSTLLTGLMLVVVGWLLTISPNVQARPRNMKRSQDTCSVKLNDESTVYASVQAAIDASSHLTDIVKIAGTCVGVESRNGFTQTAFISKSLKLQGGWKSDFSERNPDLYPTTLDAQGQGRVIAVSGYISPIIEGLRITGGTVYNWTSDNDAGGGLRVISASALITGNYLYDNISYYGGGIYLENSDSVLDHNFIFSNTAWKGGGGIWIVGGHPRIQSNSVMSNVSEWGGGLYLKTSHAEVSSNQYVANQGRSAGGGVYVEEGVVTFSNNIVISNFNTDSFTLGGGLMVQTAVATVTHNLVANNFGSLGGGIGTGLSNITFTGNTIISNTASLWGGGLYMNTCTATLVNNVVADNRTEQSGSGIFIYASTAQFLHNTISQNGGGNGTGIQIAHYLSPSYVDLTNTILVSHTVGISVTSNSTATLNATLWGTGEWANALNWQGAHVFLANNVTGDPKFADPLNHDYHLISGSAAIDSGVFAGVTTDLDGHSRLPAYGGLRVDIGAYEAEYQGVIYQAYLPVTFKKQ
jgi:hypothetical protein